MPLLDDDLNAVGCVQVEDRGTGNYTRNFMLIDFSTHKLRLYPEEAEVAGDLSVYDVQLEINCQYITKVNAAGTRPKVLNCLEIETTNGSYFMSVDSAQERDEWIDSIRKSSMRQTSRQLGAGTQRSLRENRAGYETKVVGGVVQRTPITPSNGEQPEEGAEGLTDRQDGGVRVHRSGFPRIIKAGYGVKLGAVMKNWKRRFFVLTEISLSYYKSLEELEPIKSVAVGEITSVSPSRDIPGKEHMLEIVTPSRTFYMQADTEEDMEHWVKVFNDLLRIIKPTLQQHQQVGASPQTNSTNSTDHKQISVV